MSPTGTPAGAAAVLDRLVNQVYEAALGECEWDEACDAIAQALDWLHVRLLREDSSSIALPASAQWQCETLVTGERFVAACGLPQDSMASLGPVTIVRIPLVEEAGTFLEAFTDIDPARGLETIARLRPHLARALRLYRERESRVERQRIAAWLLESLPQAVAVVAADGTIFPGNRAWRRMFPGTDTLAQVVALVDRSEGGTADGDDLAASMRELFVPVSAPVSAPMSAPASTPDQEPLRAAQRGAPARSARVSRRQVWRIGRPGSGDDRLILATALPAIAPGSESIAALAGGPQAEPRVLLIVHSSDAPDRIDTGLLADTFDLTRTETLVAQRLARGEQAQDIADARYVSRQTIRSQMRMIYRKLGVRRQADLVRIIARLPRIGTGAPMRTSALREVTRALDPDPCLHHDPDPVSDHNIQPGAAS